MIPPLLKYTRSDLRKYLHVENSRIFTNSDISIIVGQNGSGKSMVRRMLRMGCDQSKFRCYDFSQERRSGGGIGNAFLYGNESWQSTGSVTLTSFLRAFKQDPKQKHLLVWDEPEIGLSEETQLGLVQFIREHMEAKDRDEHLLGCIFMTHSRVFVRGFLDYPHLSFTDLDRRFKTAEGWVNRKVKPADIQKVKEQGIKRFRKITRMLKQKESE